MCLPSHNLPDLRSDGLIHVKVLALKWGARTMTFLVKLQCFCLDCRFSLSLTHSLAHSLSLSLCCCCYCCHSYLKKKKKKKRKKEEGCPLEEGEKTLFNKLQDRGESTP